MEYVVGFLFDPTKERVAVINKLSPEWQRGFLNGVGGKIEVGEDPHAAMVREFREEAGVEIPSWQLFAIITGKSSKIYFYRAVGDLLQLKSMTPETVITITAAHVANCRVVPNLKWLIPMATEPYLKLAEVWM